MIKSISRSFLWQNTNARYVYDVEEGDRENGVAPGTAFEDIPENWACPICGATKSYFEQKED